MKHTASISIGSSRRDKTVEVDLLGIKVSIERIGTDGSMEKATLIPASGKYRRLTHEELGQMIDRLGL